MGVRPGKPPTWRENVLFVAFSLAVATLAGIGMLEWLWLLRNTR